MFASMMTDELRMDIQECIPILESWNYHYVDLRWQVMGYAMEEMPVEAAQRLHTLLKEHDMQVGMLHSSIGKVDNAENPEVFADQMKKARQIAAIAPALEATRVRMFPLRPEGFDDFGNLDENHPAWDHVMTLNEPLFRLFSENGLEVALENAAFHINDGLNIVKGFSNYGAKLAWDLMGGWILRDQSENVDEYFERIAPYVSNIHVKSFALPQYRLCCEMDECGKTAGVLPWTKLLTALRRAGSTGPLSVETQQAQILENRPSLMDANRWLAEFVLSLADE